MSTPGGPTAKAVFGTNFSRLAQVKKKYDPNNIFHLNQNTDVRKLKRSEIIIGVNGKQWITSRRQKTDITAKIPLLP